MAKGDDTFVAALTAATLSPFHRPSLLALAAEPGLQAEVTLAVLVQRRLDHGYDLDWWSDWLRGLREARMWKLAAQGAEARQARLAGFDAALQAVRKQARQGDWPQVIASLVPLLADKPLNAELNQLQSEVLSQLAQKDPAAYLDAIETLVLDRNRAPQRDDLTDMIRIADAERRERIFAQIDRRWPESRIVPFLRRLMQRFGLSGGEADPWSEAGFAVLSGQDPAPWLDRLELSVPPADLEACRAKLLQTAPLPKGSRALVRDEAVRDLVASDPRAGEVLVLVFQTLSASVVIPREIFDGILARQGAGAIYLMDSQVAFYGAGIPSLADGLDASIAALRQMIEARAPSRVVIFGVSSGGVAAVSFGLSLGVSRMLLVSPVFSVEPEWRAAARDRRATVAARRCFELLGPRCHMPLWYEAMPHRPQTRILYGGGIDSAHASLLEGVEGVTQVPLPEAYPHAPVLQMWTEGQLEAEIDWLLH